MTNLVSDPLLAPGEQFHCLHPILLPSLTTPSRPSEFCDRGRTVTITASLLENSVDRTGESTFAVLGDDSAQIVRWGRVMLRPGPWPERALAENTLSTADKLIYSLPRDSSNSTTYGDKP